MKLTFHLMLVYASMAGLLLTSCHTQPPQNIPLYKLRGSPLESYNGFSLPREIAFLDGKLLVIDEKPSENTFGIVLEEKNGRWGKHAEFAPYGKGPGEIPFLPNFYKQKKETDTDRGFWIHDVANSAYLLYGLEKGNTDQVRVVDSKKLPRKLGLVDQMLLVTDEKVIGCSSTSQGRLFSILLENGELKHSPAIPDLPEKILENERAMAYKNHLAYNKKNKVIASAMEWFGRIDFFDQDLTHLGFYEIPSYEAPKFYTNGQSLTSGENKTYFVDIESTGDFFYVLLINATETDAISKPKCTLLKFDWRSRAPVASYQLDKLLLSFTIDESDNLIYGLNPLDENNCIYLFKIE